MRLTAVRVRNFRCIKDLSVDLDQTTVLIGENNSGKTAFLEAIRICLERVRGRGRGPFNDYDYHLPDDQSAPADADPIEITLSFVEPEATPWGDEVVLALADVLARDAEDHRSVTLRVRSAVDPDTGEFATDWDFLDADDNPLPAGKAFSQLNALQRMAPPFYLSALRDASKHFAAKGRFWRTFLAESGIPEGDRDALTQSLATLNEQLIAAHQPLRDVRSRLEDASKVVELGVNEAVSIDALPTRLFSLLSRTQVGLASRSGARIPVEFQGEGTQSLAVLLLFGAFLRSTLSDLDPDAAPITALEEPEAHLHPSAIRSLMGIVSDLPGQKLVSTHSGDLLGSVSSSSIRRLMHTSDGIVARRIEPTTLTAEETRKFDAHVRRTRGELLFAKCWLLVEGETETTLLTGAAETLRVDVDRAGVRCVEFSQTDVGMLAKVANSLGIVWYCVLDNDSGRQKYERRVRSQFGAAVEADRLTMPYESVERMLCDNGFGALYESRMSRQKPQPTSATGTSAYWAEVLNALPNSYSKPEVAADAVARMTAGTIAVPAPLSGILNKAVELAGA